MSDDTPPTATGLTQDQIDAMVADINNMTPHKRLEAMRALAAEVERLREEQTETERLAELADTAAKLAAKRKEERDAARAEVERLHRQSFADAIKSDHLRNVLEAERDQARAALARAVELLRCITETPTPIPNVTTGEYHDLVAAFLAEHEQEAKR